MTPAPQEVQAFDLLAGFLEPSPPPMSTPAWLPCAGTLPTFSQRLGGHRVVRILTMALRSLGQVIFINNPLSGLLLLLALLLQSPAMGLFSALGIATSNLTAHWMGCDRGSRLNGIYGFNGALVGSAAAALASLDAQSHLLGWLLLVAGGAALTTLLLESLGRWLLRHVGVPPLTLPFCLVTWLVLALVLALDHPALGLASPPPPTGGDGLTAVLLGSVRSFGQVFLCPSLASGLLVLAAVAAASPLAGLIGLAGGLVSSLTALALGLNPAAVSLGLGGYNGVLTALAIGGTFHATTRRSVLIALVAAAAASLVSPALARGLASAQLPLLTLPFVLATMATMLVVRRSLPSLLPVALHSMLTPEEHRRRFLVARSLLSDFRQQLQRAVTGARPLALLPLAEAGQRQQLENLFAELDRDGSGSLSVTELATGLRQRQAGKGASGTGRSHWLQLQELLTQMDLDGDGQVDSEEFGELMLRLRRLQDGRDRLLTYLRPVDADGDEHLDAAELDRLLASVGQPQLQPLERERLFGPTGGSLSWDRFIDRLLLT